LKLIIFVLTYYGLTSFLALEGFDKTNITECIYFSKEDFINKLLNLYQNKNLYESLAQKLSSIYEQNFSQNHYQLNFSKILNKIN
jgi:mannose-6-phosphate isomerase class I